MSLGSWLQYCPIDSMNEDSFIKPLLESKSLFFCRITMGESILGYKFVEGMSWEEMRSYVLCKSVFIHHLSQYLSNFKALALVPRVLRLIVQFKRKDSMKRCSSETKEDNCQEETCLDEEK
jgi:hypothetical protein